MTLPPGIDQWMEEIQSFRQKMEEGMSKFGDAHDIDVGPTEKEAVWSRDKVTLYRYRSKDRKTRGPVVLIVYALVNRPYMMDLQSDRSLIRALLDHGIDVWLIDWGYPDLSDRYLSLEEYLQGYLDECVSAVESQRGEGEVNLLGVCQGGAFSITYTAMYPKRVKNLITMVTPVDFHTDDNLLSHWVRQVDVDALVESLGNIPGEMLNWTFLSMKPFQLTSRKYVDMMDQAGDEEKMRNFLRMEKWIFDSPDQAGRAFAQFIRMYFQENGLVRGTVMIDDEPVDLRQIHQPVLNIYATEDHLVPPSASTPLQDLVASDDYTEMAFRGGHIGIYVSGRAQREIPEKIAHWLNERS